MQNKCLLISFFLLISALHATQKPSLEFKPGYSYFLDNTLQQVYSDGGAQLQISGTYPLWKNLDIYASLGAQLNQGRSLNGNEQTSLWQIPFDVGLKPIVNITDKIQAHLAFGPRFFYITQTDNSQYIDPSISQSDVGLFLNGGLNFLLKERFFIGFFAEYSYQTTTLKPTRANVYGESNLQLGGLALGATLGYSF